MLVSWGSEWEESTAITTCISDPTPPSLLYNLQESFVRAKSWVKELQRQASPNIVIALSGNKADLASKRLVDFEVHVYMCTYTVLVWVCMCLCSD